MKKMFLAMVLVFVMALSVPAFAGDIDNWISPNSGVQNTGNNAIITTGGVSGNVTANGGAGGAGGNATATQQQGMLNNNFLSNILSPSAHADADAKATASIGDIRNTNTNLNTNINSNDSSAIGVKGDVKQGQMQGQINEGNNNSINIEAQKQNLLGLPSQSVPELNFGNGRMKDATSELPNFAIYGIKKLGSEMIKEVLSMNANVKFKNLYKAILDDAKEVANGGKKTLSDVRYQVIRAEAQKSWHTGSVVSGGGSGLASNGLGGGSAAGGLFPSFGGTKADDLFTIIFVKVAL